MLVRREMQTKSLLTNIWDALDSRRGIITRDMRDVLSSIAKLDYIGTLLGLRIQNTKNNRKRRKYYNIGRDLASWDPLSSLKFINVRSY